MLTTSGTAARTRTAYKAPASFGAPHREEPRGHHHARDHGRRPEIREHTERRGCGVHHAGKSLRDALARLGSIHRAELNRPRELAPAPRGATNFCT